MSSVQPSIVLVGRPNVGKSSLFNRLTQTRQALVADWPGLTRDRLYGHGTFGHRSFIIIDTGGLTDGKQEGIDALMAKQTQQAISEADYILFMVDAQAGLTPLDQTLAQNLRKLNKPMSLVVNKSEGLAPETLLSEFSSLGFSNISFISVVHGEGTAGLMQQVWHHFPETPSEAVIESTPDPQASAPIRVALIGKPNVGKSTLINRMLGEERVMVFDAPGTTRDSTAHDFTYRGKDYTLIDTAGIRRKAKTQEMIEKFSVIKSLQAIEQSNVVLFLLDAQEGISEQDLHLLGFIIESGKALVIAVNKWDGLEEAQRSQVKKELDRRLQFIDYAKPIFISARHGTGVGNLFALIQKAYRSATRPMSTSRLTRLLEQAVRAHQPPLSRGRTVKLRYAHPGGYNPPLILIHGQHTHYLVKSYRRYLENFYRDALRIVGSPVRIEFREK